MAGGAPTATITALAPRPSVRSITRAIASSRPAQTVSSAPSSRAFSSLASIGSQQTTRANVPGPLVAERPRESSSAPLARIGPHITGAHTTVADADQDLILRRLRLRHALHPQVTRPIQHRRPHHLAHPPPPRCVSVDY